MPRWSGQETSSVAVSAFAGARMARRVRDLCGQKKAPRAGAGGPAAFGAATASALSGRWRWEPASPLPRFREVRLVASGRRHLTRRSTALVHRITSVSAWGTSSGAQTPPPDRFPRWSPLPPLSGRPTAADFGRSRTRGRVRSPVLRSLSDARRFDHSPGTGAPAGFVFARARDSGPGRWKPSQDLALVGPDRAGPSGWEFPGRPTEVGEDHGHRVAHGILAQQRRLGAEGGGDHEHAREVGPRSARRGVPGMGPREDV